MDPYLSLDLTKAVHRRSKTMLSAPQSNLDTTFSKYNAFRHLAFKYLIWGINDNLMSNITPLNDNLMSNITPLNLCS